MQLVKQRRAIPFIIRNQQKNQYEITKEAQDLLKSIEKNISVVSVVGPYRTGKSYLLNSVILDKKGIFTIGSSVNPCTKGIWLWVQPDPLTEKRSMLVIDTEGLGTFHDEANNEIKVFCLVVLISSMFIYNSINYIDENALQTLHIVVSIANSIDQINTLSKPQFIWVVRDFVLQRADASGKSLTPHEYLETILNTRSKQIYKTQVRETITTAFAQRDCFTLVKPLIDETKIQNLDKIALDELRPQFVSQCIELRNKIKSNLREVKFTQSSNNITGREYLMIVQKYLDVINSGGVTNVGNILEFVKEEKEKDALQEIRRIYTEKINSKIISKIPIKKTLLEQLFGLMKEQAKILYCKMTDDKESNSAVEQLFVNAFQQSQKINAEQNRLQIQNLLMRQFQPFVKKLYSHYYNDYEEYENEVYKNFKDNIMVKNGEKVDELKENVEKFCQQKLIQNFRYFQKKLKDEIKTLKSARDDLETSLIRQMTEINREKEKNQRAQQEKLFNLQNQIMAFKDEREQFIQFGNVEKILIESNISFLKNKNQQQSHRIEDLTKDITNLQASQNQLKEKHFMEHKEYQKQKALFCQKQQYMNARIKQLQQKVSEYKNKISEEAIKFQMEKKIIMKCSQQKLSMQEQSNKIITQKLIEMQLKQNKYLQQIKQLSQQFHLLKVNSASQIKQLQQQLLQTEFKKKSSKLQLQLRQQNQELTTEMEKLNQKYQQTSKKLKSTQEQLTHLQNNLQKEIAVHVQQIQFQELEIKDSKNRYDEIKKSYQHILENSHNSKNSENNLQDKIDQLSAQHQKKIKNLETENYTKIKSLKKQIEMLQKDKDQLQFQQSIHTKNLQYFQSKEKQQKQSRNMLQTLVKKLEEKIESLEKDYQNSTKQKQVFYAMRIKQLQQQLQQQKQKVSQQLNENEKKSQQTLTVLKHDSSIQKQQWQKRFDDEKDRAQKKAKQIQQQFENKQCKQCSSFQQQIASLQSRLAHMQRIYNQKLQNMQYEYDIQLQKKANEYRQKLLQQNKQLALAHDKISTMKNNYENEIFQKTRTFENQRHSLKLRYDNQIKQISKEKCSVEQKYQSTQEINRELIQNNLILKNDAEREISIFKEKEKLMEKRIIQLQNKVQNELNTYNKTIESINEHHRLQINNLKQQINKLNFSITCFQQQRAKLEAQHENSTNRLQTKLKTLQQSKNKNKQQYEDMVSKFQSVINHLSQQKKKYGSQKQKMLQNTNEKKNQCTKQLQQDYKKVLESNEEKINRLIYENTNLKEIIIVSQIEKQINIKRIHSQGNQNERFDKKYQKCIDQYKLIYEKQKQKTKKLKDDNCRLKVQVDGTNINPFHLMNNYCDRSNFQDISNRLHISPNNINTTQSKRKFVITPTGNQKGFNQLGTIRLNATAHKTRQ